MNRLVATCLQVCHMSILSIQQDTYRRNLGGRLPHTFRQRVYSTIRNFFHIRRTEFRCKSCITKTLQKEENKNHDRLGTQSYQIISFQICCTHFQQVPCFCWVVKPVNQFEPIQLGNEPKFFMSRFLFHIFHKNLGIFF